jgi:cell division protein FtsI (penicillin-binding protein 3)
MAKKLSFFKLGYELDIDLLYKNKKDKKNVIYRAKQRLDIIYFIIVLFFALLSLRLFHINIFHETIEKTNTYRKDEQYKRIDIVDRNGEILASNLPVLNLVANPKKILYPKQTAKGLAKIFPNLKYSEIKKDLTKNSSFKYLKKNISPYEKEKILKLGEPGLWFEEKEYRIYPYSNLFSHILGNVDSENIGIEGIEKYYNLTIKNLENENFQLAISKKLQSVLREVLMKEYQKLNANFAAAIVMDVNTGEILSTVSLPDYNPGDLGKGIPGNARYNHALFDILELGSVFKPFNVAAAVESGMITDPYTVYYDVSKDLKMGSFTISDVNKNTLLNVAEILVQSSNIGSAKLAQDIGSKYQIKFLNSLNMFSKLNLDLPEIQTPLYPKEWDEFANATISYGYGISVSALHVLSAFSALVNGGYYIDPKFKKVENTSEITKRKIISEPTSNIMRELLRLVLVEGSGKKANVEGLLIAGKTGSAKKLVEGKYSDRKLTTSFVGAFPIHKPEYAIYVLIDEADFHRPYGMCRLSSCNVVPAAGNIIDAIAPVLGVKKLSKEEVENFDNKILNKLKLNEAENLKGYNI